MTGQPPAQPPHQPSGHPAESNPATQPMPAAGGVPPGVPPAPPRPDGPNLWHQTTSTRGGRWAIAVAAGAVGLLMLLGIGLAGLLVLRHHDGFSLMGQRQDARSPDKQGPRGQLAPGNGRGPGANGGDRPSQPGMPGMPGMRGGRAQGLGGLGGVLGGALHGTVTSTVNGSAQALVFQGGEVTAVSATSITLKSSDGFVGTYGRNASTQANGAGPAKGGQAFVLARASDKVALRTMVMPATAGAVPNS